MRTLLALGKEVSGSQQFPSFPLSFISGMWINSISRGKQCLRVNLLSSKESSGDIIDFRVSKRDENALSAPSPGQRQKGRGRTCGPSEFLHQRSSC